MSGVRSSSSSLNKSYGSIDDCPNPEAIAEMTRLLLVMLSGLITGTRQCLAQYSFSTFFRQSSWYWVVQDVLSSGLISIPLSQFLTDRNFRKGSRICAEIISIPFDGVTSAEYLDSCCRANFMAKNKSSFH